MTDNPSKYELLQSMASRKKDMEILNNTVAQLKAKIKQLKRKHDELKNLNYLDDILLKELYNGTN